MPDWSVQNLTLKQRRIVFGVIVVAVLCFFGYVFLVMRSAGTAAAGTTVGGVDIGGLSQEQASAKVADELHKRVDKKLRVMALDQTFVVKPRDAGLQLDAAGSVAPAFERTWSPPALFGRMFGGDAYPAVAAVDDAALTEQVQLIADALDKPAVEPAITMQNGAPRLVAGAAGRSLDESATKAQLVESVVQRRKPIKAVVVRVDPTVSQGSTDAALELARNATSAGVVVHAESVTTTIQPKAIGRALAFSADSGALVPSLDGAVLHHSIRKALAPIEVPGRNATFKIRHGKPKVVKSKVGKGVSDSELASAVDGVLDKPANQRDVTVSVGVREPELTTEQAKALGVKERLSSFTQYFPYAAYRVQNIGEAAKRINGTLLMPGDTFSMNGTIKERTRKNGYTVGFVVGEGGVFDEQLGGGVSTATTATWTAAFFAGMERVQTVAHSIYISRYQAGLEATVAWGIFDMKFRNDTPNAVFMTSSITNGSITVALWGTKVYDKVVAESGKRTNVRPFDTIYDKSKKCLGQGGVDGFDIVVDRVFYKDGQVVKREPITTKYKPAPEVICGKKPPKKPGKHPGKPGKHPSGTPGNSPTPSATASRAPSPSPSHSASEPDGITFGTASPSATKPAKPHRAR